MALTGDLIDGAPDALRDDIAPLGKLRARYGVFGLTGNHEYYFRVNGGLVLMIGLSLLPIGLMQTWASIEHGLWYARSAEFLQQPAMGTLRWMRMIGDTVFLIGVGALAYLLTGLFTGWSYQRPETLHQPSGDPHAEKLTA